ncbi:MAG: hypothetical protein ABI947_13370 [Chloroflexota bacterium]
MKSKDQEDQSNQFETTGRVIMQQGGYSRRRLPGSIFILRLEDASPATIEAWYEDCNNLMSRWQPDQRLRYLHDIRGAEWVNSQTMDRVTRVLRRLRYIPVGDGRGAIVLNNTTIASLLSTFFKRRPHANWDIRFFSDPTEALAWLANE